MRRMHPDAAAVLRWLWLFQPEWLGLPSGTHTGRAVPCGVVVVTVRLIPEVPA